MRVLKQRVGIGVAKVAEGSELVDPDEGTETTSARAGGHPRPGSELVDPDEGTETLNTTD